MGNIDDSVESVGRLSVLVNFLFIAHHDVIIISKVVTDSLNKDFMKNLVKVIKTLFDRSSISDQFDNFKKFLHSHIKAPDWSKLEEGWEDFWLPTLYRNWVKI